MTKTVSDAKVFLDEYTAHAAVLKYTKATAGAGISYLLDHEYKAIYLEALKHLPLHVLASGLRLLEFGCGGGMNLIHLTAVLEGQGHRVEAAVGTDFSPTLIESARKEAQQYLPLKQREKISFFVGKNETLVDDLSTGMRKPVQEIKGSFHFILGVNTIRYCHRLGNEIQCANAIRDLLVPGGVCVVIDMNDKFPAFRSALRHPFRKRVGEFYLPALKEYEAPFIKTGFHVVRTGNFCWVPHSAGPALATMMRSISPVLNTVARSRAMRSLVVAQKPKV